MSIEESSNKTRKNTAINIASPDLAKPFPADHKTGPRLVNFFMTQGKMDQFVHLADTPGSAMVTGIGGSQKAFLAAVIRNKRPMLIITPEEKEIYHWQQDLSFFDPKAEILSFPQTEEADFKVNFSSSERLRTRMHTLSALISHRPAVVIATPVEVAQLIPEKADLGREAFEIHENDELTHEDIADKLVKLGYERADQVERNGHFSIRGDIVDVYPINEENPVRIEFFGDDVDSIRYFDADTQRSLSQIKSISIYPVFFSSEKKTVITSYFQNGLILYDEPQRSEEAIRRYLREEKENRSKILSWADVVSRGHAKKKNQNSEIVFAALKREMEGFHFHEVLSWPGQTMTNYQRQYPVFLTDLKGLLNRKEEVIILAPGVSERDEIVSVLNGDKISVSDAPLKGKAALINGILSNGFELPPLGLAVITSGDIGGQQKIRRYRSVKHGQAIRYFSDLHPGDYVVQDVHGIGKYLGVNTITLDGIHRDYITIQYAGGDKLYLPMEQISTLEKYIGPEGGTPVLSKMGGASWDKIRSKSRKSIEDLAGRLLDVYAKREITPGIAFLPDSAEQREFEDAFPYVETDDQLHAIAEIKKDMEKPIPMDMLLCGDVGFGKTEVAMRAVFKCIMSGYQALVLCPTTVLSEQHYKTFKERMEPFGVHVGLLNRFVSNAQKKEVLEKLKTGETDVLIGTHAVLSKKIKFKKLGLLVIDEEQRFGVVQKEKWKKWASGIDILSLSATPIPRTLHMSLTGVRDMVTLAEPPAGRHAIQTYVTEYNDQIAIEALIREKERHGQSYFVYNRIETIHDMEVHLRKLLPPDISIGVAFGRMESSKLENTMMQFYEGKIDVLLCTTLIENGLDQPNANTMIVYDADRLGLSQIYQMRGRVGRSEKIARAYFFYRKGKVLSEVAEKRLDTIREFTELGSGFKIAMRDLEIRGAGNLLGAAQHGNIASVGFATYCNMLEDAIEQLKAKRDHKPLPKKLPNTTVEFQADAYLDPSYIPDEEEKMEIYRRLAAVNDRKELEDLIDEAVDRFGTPTAPVELLFTIAGIRVDARHLGIGSIIEQKDDLLITWEDEEPMHGFNPAKLPETWFPYIHFLPGVPSRVKIKRTGPGKNSIQIISDFMKEIEKQLSSLKKKSPSEIEN